MAKLEDFLAKECQIKMKWQIKEGILKEALNECKNDVIMETQNFKASKIPGVEHFLQLKIHEDEEDIIWIYLGLDFETTKNITAAFILGVKSASKMREFKDTVYKDSEAWGHTLCTRDELFNPEKKFFVDGIMEIELEGILKAQDLKPPVFQGSSTLLNILWENDDEKDITISVGDQNVNIHKWVLCAKSDVFKAELNNSQFNESIEKKINITDFCFDTVKIAVKFFYERDIKDLINEENASQLLHFSDKYNVQPLHDLIQNLLIEKLSEENVAEFANMSVTGNAAELRDYCICIIENAIAKSSFIKDAEKLEDEILAEITRRSLFYTSK